MAVNQSTYHTEASFTCSHVAITSLLSKQVSQPISGRWTSDPLLFFVGPLANAASRLYTAATLVLRRPARVYSPSCIKLSVAKKHHVLYVQIDSFYIYASNYRKQ
jgi:hypothetical protein